MSDENKKPLQVYFSPEDYKAINDLMRLMHITTMAQLIKTLIHEKNDSISGV